MASTHQMPGDLTPSWQPKMSTDITDVPNGGEGTTLPPVEKHCSGEQYTFNLTKGSYFTQPMQTTYPYKWKLDLVPSTMKWYMSLSQLSLLAGKETNPFLWKLICAGFSDCHLMLSYPDFLPRISSTCRRHLRHLQGDVLFNSIFSNPALIQQQWWTASCNWPGRKTK